MIEFRGDQQAQAPRRLPVPQQDLADVKAAQEEAELYGAMQCAHLEALIKDMEYEPSWRIEADLNAAYYDGHQTTDEQKRLEAEGQPVVVVNLIARAINAMLGQEAKARANWRVSADSDDMTDVSDAIQAKLVEAQRETYADMAISEAYASMCKAGIGWVEVSRVSDPFAPYRYRVKAIHRNEIWWDWRSKELDLSDAAWLVRQRWMDLADGVAQFPQYEDLFRYYGRGTWSAAQLMDAVAGFTHVQIKRFDDFERVRRAFAQTVSDDKWIDTGRARVRLYEVWYRAYRDAKALVFLDGSPSLEFKADNPVHLQALAMGAAQLVETRKKVIRQALYIGPHRIKDEEVEAKRFPYIPFFGFRDDQDRSPYSPVSGMRYPQDEYNARRSRLMWLLQAAQTFIDNDALDPAYNDFATLAREIMRPDATFILNAQRRNGRDAIRIDRTTQMPAEQVNVMQDAKQLIQEQPGIYTAMLGDAPTGVTSGLAINSLVEQGAIALGDFNDSYRYARRLVGESLTDLITDDLAKVPNYTMVVGLGAGKRKVVLNQQTPQGPVNPVRNAPIRIALEDAPSTPAFRMQQQQQIAAVLQVGGNDPAVRAVLIPSFIEATDLPNREADARTLRQMYGVPQPGDKAQADQAQQQAAMKAKQQEALQQAAVSADLDEKRAKTEQARTAAQLNAARAEEITHRMNEPQDPLDAAIGESINEAKQSKDQAEERSEGNGNA